MDIDYFETTQYLEWLKEKLRLNNLAGRAKNRVVRRGEVYECYFGIGIGSEERKKRPCVILQNDTANKNSGNVLVAPISHSFCTSPVVIPIVAQTDSNGITILDGTTVRLYKGDEFVSLTGNYYYYDYPPCEADFNIWLNHFPENFEPIAEQTKKDGNQMDLMFSGHAHGGLIRLPFVGGGIGHNGLFPDYTSGLCEYDGSYMIVSRGLGNSGNVPRVSSTMHIVICELQREE